MAHRIEPAPNSMAPLAIHAENVADGQLEPFDPSQDAPFDFTEPWEAPPEGHDEPNTFQLLAVDQALCPSPDPLLSDRLWLSTEFTGPHGRKVRIRAQNVVGPEANLDRYLGVVLNSYDVHHVPGREPLWYARPLLAWGCFDIEVDDVLTDANILGELELLHHPSTGAPVLSFTVHPRRVDDEGNVRATPLLAAEEMGMAGWRLRWPGIEYRQAPVVRVRIERGDTLEGIAKEFAVDPLLIHRVNRHIHDPHDLPRGEALAIPLLSDRERRSRQVHPSTALSWYEIVRGWSTLN